MAPNFRQTAVYVGNDPQIESQLTEGFFTSEVLHLCSTTSALANLDKIHVNSLILDEDMFKKEGEHGRDFSKMETACQLVLVRNPKAMIIILASENSRLSPFKKVPDDAILILSKNDFQVSTLQYLQRLFASQEYRTIYLRDLKVGDKFSASLYLYRSKLKDYSILFQAGDALEEKKLQALKKANIAHLYVQSQDIQKALDADKGHGQLPLSELIHQMRKEIRTVMMRVLDIRSEDGLPFGKKLLDDSLAIYGKVQRAVSYFGNDLISAMEHLPYERPSFLAAQVNRLLMAEVLGKVMELSSKECKDLFLGVLFARIGFSKCKFQDESNSFNWNYPSYSLALVENRRIPLSEDSLQIIVGHREHWDGTGVPNGLMGEKISFLTGLVHIIRDLDFFKTESASRGENAMGSLREAWIKLLESDRTRFGGKRYNPKVMDRLARYMEKI